MSTPQCFNYPAFQAARNELINDIKVFQKHKVEISFSLACDMYKKVVQDHIALYMEGSNIAFETIGCVWNDDLAKEFGVNHFCDSSLYTFKENSSLLGHLAPSQEL
jgi:hypothetical protein